MGLRNRLEGLITDPTANLRISGRRFANPEIALSGSWGRTDLAPRVRRCRPGLNRRDCRCLLLCVYCLLLSGFVGLALGGFAPRSALLGGPVTQ